MKRSPLPLVLGLTVMLAPAFAGAADWPQWRGPSFNGSTDEKNLPTNWSKETALWKIELPGPGASTPVIYGDLIFLTTPNLAYQSLHALCLDRKTGKTLWNKQVGEGAVNLDERSNYASPSAVADATRVFFYFGNGTLMAYDHSGKELWSRNIQKDYGDFAFNWTFSSSPVLYNGKIYLQVLQRNEPVHNHGRTDGPIESFLLVINPADGKTLHREVRETDARLEAHEAYSTPVPFESQGKKSILVLGANYVTAHNPEDGTEIWRSVTLNPRRIDNWRQVSSLVAGNGVILACQPQMGSLATAIKPEGTGTLADSTVIWKSDQQHREISSDVPTPMFYDGDFFVLSDGKKSLTRVEPATGNVKWTLALPGTKKFEASPTGADGKVYLINFAGDVVVVDAAKGEILGNMPMGDAGDDFIRSSVSISRGQLFIRTNHKLYCIGSK